MSRKPEIGLDIYLKEIRKLESQARQCYSESVQLNTDEFVKMLVLDGCFILEYILKSENKETDVLCDVGWDQPTIIADLLLLENQIPFFILHKLASLSSDQKDCHTCEDSCDVLQNLRKLSSILPNKEMLKLPKISCEAIQHLLHLYYICLIPKFCTEHSNHPMMKHSLFTPWMRDPSQAREGKGLDKHSVVLRNAAELHRSGVKFLKNSSHNFFDIKFKKGVIEMPVLVMNNTISTIFSNLVAFEQSQINRSRIFTSYVVLWNMLVDTARDVKILEDCGILQLVQCNEEQAAKFFNEWADCWSIDYNKHHYAMLFRQLHEHKGNIWNRLAGKMNNDSHKVLMKVYKSFATVGGVASVGSSATLVPSTEIRPGVQIHEILCHFLH